MAKIGLKREEANETTSKLVATYNDGLDFEKAPREKRSSRATV